MVDTVILRISRDDFIISPSVYSHFSQSICTILDETIKTRRFVKSSYTLPKELNQSGLYFPKFSVMKAARHGGYAIYAHIEFSAPKILFGNNFDEFTGNELREVCKTLSERLEMMGVIIQPEKLASATVSTIHYGKNVPFTDYTTASQIISDLAKCDTTVRKQYNIRDFGNNGEALYLQTRNSGLVVYDKVQELKTAHHKKGRFEGDNQCQFSILDRVETPFEVVRIETRLRNPEAIRNVFSRCNIGLHNGNFCDLFSKDIAQTILLDAFSPFAATQNNLVGIRSSLRDFAVELKRGSPEISPRAILMIIGLKAMLDEDGFRDIRKEISATSGQWLRIKETVNKANIATRNQSSVNIVRQALEEFRPVRLGDYMSDDIDSIS